MNDYQKHRFAKQIIDTLFNTVSGKKIAFLGWAFKKDTNDTRESAAIYVAHELLQDKAEIHIYDPKVTKEQIDRDLQQLTSNCPEPHEEVTVHVHTDPYVAMDKAHAIAVLTEWDEFRNYNWQTIYENVYKPAFIFDGRNILDAPKLKEIGFGLKTIGKG